MVPNAYTSTRHVDLVVHVPDQTVLTYIHRRRLHHHRHRRIITQQEQQQRRLDEHPHRLDQKAQQ